MLFRRASTAKGYKLDYHFMQRWKILSNWAKQRNLTAIYNVVFKIKEYFFKTIQWE
jgi:hypothetical protein